MSTPPVRYTDSGGHSIAYRFSGSGRTDLVFVMPTLGTIEVLWEPPAARMLAEYEQFARVISFDRRGVGLSGKAADPPTLEQQLDDMDAVLDAARCGRTVVYSEAEGSMLALLYAASRPERVSHVVLLHGMARLTSAPGYEWTWSAAERRAAYIDPVLNAWGSAAAAELLAPVLFSRDPDLRGWWQRFERISGAPSTLRPMLELAGEMDVRGILGQVSVPTLILNRPDAVAISDRHAEFLAAEIPGAELRQLPGRDAISIGDGYEETIAAVRQFIAGEEGRVSGSRSLATVLFTDIVASTERAAEVGDARWRELLETHEELSRRLVAHHGGRVVKSTGDGMLATFDGPARAVRAARTLCAEAPERLGLELRAGLHTGEIELIGSDIGGMGVHIGARIGALANPGEVLVSSTVRDLVAGSGLEFVQRGSAALKGVPGEWRLFVAAGEAG